MAVSLLVLGAQVCLVSDGAKLRPNFKLRVTCPADAGGKSALSRCRRHPRAMQVTRAPHALLAAIALTLFTVLLVRSTPTDDQRAEPLKVYVFAHDWCEMFHFGAVPSQR